MAERVQSRYRLGVSARAGARLRVNARVEYTTVSYPALRRIEEGILLFQEVRYAPGAWLAVEGRLAFFDTDSYDSRMYATEGDLDGVFSNAMLFGRGKRWYIVVRLRPFFSFRVSAKYSVAAKELLADTMPTERQLSVQLDLRF